MARKPDGALRRELVERALDYVMENGLSDLSLKPMAEAIGSTPSLLLYHFESKDALIGAIIKAGRARQQAIMQSVDLSGRSESESARILWRAWSKPKWLALTRLFFEVYVLAMQSPSRFPGFLDEAVHDWISALADGAKAPQARAHATVLLAAFRGFLLDLCATGERARVDRAVELFIRTLDGDAKTELADAAR